MCKKKSNSDKVYEKYGGKYSEGAWISEKQRKHMANERRIQNIIKVILTVGHCISAYEAAL